jgi:hypothetical protein
MDKSERFNDRYIIGELQSITPGPGHYETENNLFTQFRYDHDQQAFGSSS